MAEFVFDLTSFDGGMYIDKQLGTFGTINFVIEPLGSSVWDMATGIFGKSSQRIIHGVPEREGEGWFYVPDAATAWGIGIYFILKSNRKDNLFEQHFGKNYATVVEKINKLEDERERERKAYETYRAERMTMTFDEIMKIVNLLSPEQKRKVREGLDRFGTEGDTRG